MSAAHEPAEAAAAPEISEAAQLARERLHEEIERVRSGVEEMLDERDSNGGANGTPAVASPLLASEKELQHEYDDLRRDLDEMRAETRDYVKRKVRKSEKRLERSIRELEARSDELEQRIDEVEADREEAEWRIHDNTERILDGLLDDVRSIADRLAEQPPAPPASPPMLPKAAAPPPPPPAAKRPRMKPAIGRIGRPPKQ